MGNHLKAVTMAQLLLSEKVKRADFLLDATAGNGFDTLFLTETSKETARIWAFDIQEEAVATARQLLEENGRADKVHFVLDCHSRIARYIPGAIDAAMFNLGYLPKSNHTVKTSPATTVAALEQTCACLAAGGLISVVAYPGHAGGQAEYKAVTDFLANLPPGDFAVGCWSMLNQANCPPVLFIVEKK